MIAICIGHSRGDGGAVGVGGMNEWHYNRELGQLILADLRDRGFEALLIDRYAQTGYGRAMDQLAGTLKSAGVTCAVELHFNAADSPSATGHEWLHWHASASGRALAQCLDRRMTETFPNHKRRGLRAIEGDDRGGTFLRKTTCPSVICEPFFGTNPTDWKLATEHRRELAQVIADGIDDWRGGSAS